MDSDPAVTAERVCTIVGYVPPNHVDGAVPVRLFNVDDLSILQKALPEASQMHGKKLTFCSARNRSKTISCAL